MFIIVIFKFNTVFRNSIRFLSRFSVLFYFFWMKAILIQRADSFLYIKIECYRFLQEHRLILKLTTELTLYWYVVPSSNPKNSNIPFCFFFFIFHRILYRCVECFLFYYRFNILPSFKKKPSLYDVVGGEIIEL